MKQSNKFSPEVRERAVRMMQDQLAVLVGFTREWALKALLL